MAVAFGSISSTTYAARTTTTVITAPSGIADGDKLLAFLFQLRTGSTTAPSAPTAPTGFTLVGTSGSGQSDFTTAHRIGVYQKTASGESGDYTFTVTGTNTTHTQGVVARYTGVDTTNPINGTPTNLVEQQPANTTRTWTGLTTTVANCMLVAIGWDYADNAPDESPPTSFTERLDNELTAWFDLIQASAAATGNKTNTCDSASGSPRGGILLALAPAASGAASADVTTNLLTTSVGAATVQAKANVSPTTNLATVSVGQATVQAKATTSPTTNLLTASVDQATVSAKANVTVADQALAISVDQVTVDTGSAGVDVNVASQTLAVSVDAVTASGAANVTTTTNLLTASVDAVTVQARASVTVEGQVVTAAVDQATVTGKANVSPTTNLLTTSVGGVTVAAGATASPTTNLLTASVGQVTVNAIANVQVEVTGNLLSMSVGQVVVEDDSGIVIPVYARRKQMLSNPPRMMGN